MDNYEIEHPIEFENTDKLELDHENPRLPVSVGRKQREMLEYIAEETSIEELMEAIGKNGYFPGEPLITVKEGNKYRVIEGNRRLTALRLLQNPTLIPKRSAIIEAAKSASQKPQVVPIVIFSNRDEVLSYLGYRHISGIKEWDPLSKARYAFQIFEKKTKKADRPETRYLAVAQAIGSKPHYVKRILNALAIYNYLEKKSFFGIEELQGDEKINFSLLSTAIGYEDIYGFLKIQGDPIIKIRSISSANLKDLARWIFQKEKGGKTKLGESRQLSKLNKIVADARALREFKTGATVEQAYRFTAGLKEDFNDQLYAALTALENANKTIANVNIDESQKDLTERIYQQAALLRKNVAPSD